MNYFMEMMGIWWASLLQTVRDESWRFPLAALIGVMLAILCWVMAAFSARLWNKKFYLKVGLQFLCGFAALLTLVYAVTFVSSDSIASAVRERLTEWEGEAKNDADWQNEAFKHAYDEVARLGSEPNVKKSPSPRTDSSITTLPMSNPETRLVVARAHVYSAVTYFDEKCPYLTSALNAPGEVPDDMLKEDLKEWFNKNPGTAYPQERGISVLLKILRSDADKQIEPVVNFTKRMSLVLFVFTQLVVFILIAFFSYRSIRPTR